MYKDIVISSGHGLHVPGARGIIDEVTEARKVTDCVAKILNQMGINASVFHDNTSRGQRDNVSNIVRHHNSLQRDLDVSVHFNAVSGGTREAGIGVETLYRSGNDKMRSLAGDISSAIAAASGLILRHKWRDVAGTVPRTDLGFLNNTTRPAVLIEVCFVNSSEDVRLYNVFFEMICIAIAEAVAGKAKTSVSSSGDADTLSENTGTYPLSSRNLHAMVYRGVMQTPEYWLTVNNVRYLNDLLTNAAAPGRLDRRINNGIIDVEIALDTLVDAGIIRSPEYWRGLMRQENPVRYLDQLIINIANRSRNVLERIIHAEARGEDLKGQVLVGNVILNRSRNAGFPHGIRNVVFASGVNSHGVVTYQFSPVGSGAYARAINIGGTTKQAVDHILNDVDYSRGATFFRSVRGLNGSWHQTALRYLFTHGNHAFFTN